MPTPMPIPLSDAAMETLLHMAQPLAVEDRSEFLQRVADRLAQEPLIGDGVIYRVARAVQAELLTVHWRAAGGARKWRDSFRDEGAAPAHSARAWGGEPAKGPLR